MSPHLFLLEDEMNVGSTLKARLEHEGYQVSWVQSIADAKKKLLDRTHSYLLALLDVNLPDGNGFEIAKTIRTSHPTMAIVFLTAAGTPEDRIHGLEIGAEDYIVKPFNIKELILRIQNALKRAQFVSNSGTAHAVSIGKANVYFSKYELHLGSAITHLSHKECALLKLLHEKRGEVVSRDDILNLVWSEDEYPTPRTIDNFVLRLRKLVEPNPEQPSVIRSVRGVGYLMEKSTVESQS